MAKQARWLPVDQSVMTDESLPVDKGAGEDVFCGTINRFGAIDINATKFTERKGEKH